MYKKRSYPRRKAPARKYPKRVYKKRSTSFVKRVKRIIHSQLENKVLSGYAANQSIVNAGSITDPTRIILTPAITQGAGANQRTGNAVRVVKAHARGYVNLKPYNATNNSQSSPLYVKMWLCRRQTTNLTISSAPTTTDYAQFFQTGNSAVPFQSNMLDMTLFVNKDYWNVLATKTIQLCNVGYGSQASASNIAPGSSNVSAPFYFNLTKHLGLCKYNDNNASYLPTNKELFLVFQAVLADGSISGGILDACEFHYAVQYEYEDA